MELIVVSALSCSLALGLTVTAVAFRPRSGDQFREGWQIATRRSLRRTQIPSSKVYAARCHAAAASASHLISKPHGGVRANRDHSLRNSLIHKAHAPRPPSALW